jgi:hypothetical protein
MRVQAGTNWFSARKDWRSQRNTAAIIAGQTNHVRIELIPPPRITGTVRDASGIPAAGVLVLFHPGQYPDAPDYAEVKTDKSGRYEMILKLSRETMAWDGEISPTNFILARSLERNLAAIQEFAAFPTNLDLTLQPGITLSGSVKNSEGAPVTNATVNLSILAGGSIPKLSPRPTKVDAQGSFTFPALPQGREYYFFQGITAKGSGTAGGRLKAEDSKTNHYEFPAFVLERADRILAGRVLDEDGHPLAGADVRFGGKGQQEWPTTKSDRHGNFFFDAVCEGEVHLSATAFIDGPPGEGIFLTGYEHRHHPPRYERQKQNPLAQRGTKWRLGKGQGVAQKKSRTGFQQRHQQLRWHDVFARRDGIASGGAQGRHGHGRLAADQQRRCQCH